MLTSEQIKRLQSKIGNPSDQSNLTVQEKNAKYLANLRQSLKTKSDMEEYRKTDEGMSFMDKLKNIGIGAGKGALSTFRSMSSLGEKAITGIGRAITPKSLEKKLGFSKQEQTSAEKLIPEELTEAKGTYQKIGKFGEQLGEFILPAGAISKLGKTAEATIKAATGIKKLGTIGKISTGGLGFGGISSIQKGEFDKEGFINAITVEAALPVLGKITQPLTSSIKKLPSRFIRSALGKNKGQMIKDIKDGTDDLSKYIIKNKPISTLNKLFEDSSQAIGNLSKKINKNLQSAIRKSGFKKSIGRDNLLDMVVKSPESQNALLNRQDVREVVERLVPQSKKFIEKSSLNLEDANKLRQLLDRTLGDRGFIADKLPNDKEILRNVANILREEVKKKAPEGTRGLFDKLSNEIRLNNLTLDKLAQRAGNEIINLGDLIVGGAFGVAGGGIGGSIGAAAVLRILRSTPFKISSAKTLEFINLNAQKLEALSPQIRATIIKTINDAFSDENDND